MRLTDLARCTRKQLLEIAKQHGIKGVSRLRKQELFDRLRQALSLLPPPPPSSQSLESEAVEQSAQAVEPVVTTPQLRSVQPAPVESLLAPTPPAAAEPAVLSSPSLSVPPAATESLAASTPSPSEPGVEQSDQAAADSKFFLGAQSFDIGAEAEVLPASYSDNRIVLLPRDPYGVYAYWDFSDERWTQAQKQRAADDDRLVLRVFDVTYVEFTGANAWSSADIELTPYATSWYVAVPRSDASYCAEIGYQSRSGRFISLGRSNVVITPRVEASPSTTVRWLTPPERRTTEQQHQTTALSAPPRRRPAWTPPAPGISHLPAPSSAEYSSLWRTPRRA